MSSPRLDARGIGHEGQTLVVIDDFADDAQALREAALSARFAPAGEHYPGIRAPLPASYLTAQLPLITRVMQGIFGRYGSVETIAATYSIVTAPAAALSEAQRMPHCDAFTADRYALVHYLALDQDDGTAFYRHRATGFETIDPARRERYAAALREERQRLGPVAAGYVGGSDERFEQIACVPGRFNRAVLYPSFLLHSGAIAADAALSADPRTGRLTITGFFQVALTPPR